MASRQRSRVSFYRAHVASPPPCKVSTRARSQTGKLGGLARLTFGAKNGVGAALTAGAAPSSCSATIRCLDHGRIGALLDYHSCAAVTSMRMNQRYWINAEPDHHQDERRGHRAARPWDRTHKAA